MPELSVIDDLVNGPDSGFLGPAVDDLIHDLDAEIVLERIVSQSEYYTYADVIVKFGDGDHVLFSVERPSTPNVEPDGKIIQEFYKVEPYETTVTDYRRV